MSTVLLMPGKQYYNHLIHNGSTRNDEGDYMKKDRVGQRKAIRAPGHVC